MRDIVKELLLDSALPVKSSELKDLGIDIASAPANGTIGDRQVCIYLLRSGSNSKSCYQSNLCRRFCIPGVY